MSEPEREVVKQAQEDAELEREGREQAATDPADRDDPREDREPPNPFSGPTR